MLDDYTREGFFIDGAVHRSVGTETYEVICPSDRTKIGTVPVATHDDIDRAIGAARRSFASSGWKELAVAERVAVIERAADLLEGRVGEIGKIMTAEMGQPIAAGPTPAWGTTTGHIPSSIAMMRLWARYALQVPVTEIRHDGIPVPAVVRREPYGVVAGICPWNGPFAMAVNKAIIALLAGSSVIVKPAPETPFDAYYLAEALTEAGVPPGIMNVLPAAGAVSEYLVGAKGVDKVSFTGSTSVGRQIGAICGGLLRRVQLELGGKSAGILLEDVDLESAATSLIAGSFRNCGQICFALARILVPRSRYSEVVDFYVDAAQSLEVGDPFRPETQVGPMVSERQRSRVEEYIEIGKGEGAMLATGGRRPPELDMGWFIEPAVFANVDNSMRIAREEIFGPVACIMAYDDVDDAVRITNDSNYGLYASVFTADEERAYQIATRIESGVVSVNDFTVNLAAPFGGMKDSGIGREHGLEGIEEAYEYKTINLSSKQATLIGER